MHKINIMSLLDGNALFLLGNIVLWRLAIGLKERKIIKERIVFGGEFLSRKQTCTGSAYRFFASA
jgi:hypothetical protein